MSSKQEIVDFLVQQMSDAGTVSSRKMFGEYAVYCDEKVVGLICDDQLFFKPTNAGRAFLKKIEEKPPYPGAKPYFLIADDNWDDAEWLSELTKISASELPVPRKKPTSQNAPNAKTR